MLFYKHICCFLAAGFSLLYSHAQKDSLVAKSLPTQNSTPGLKIITDSLPLNKVLPVSSTVSDKILSSLNRSISIKNNPLPAQRDLLLREGQNLKASLNGIKKDVLLNKTQAFSFKDASVAINGQTGNLNSDSFALYNYNRVDADLSGMIAGIPFNALYQNYNYPFLSTNNQARTSFRYDKDVYLENLKKKLKGKINPNEFLNEIKDPVELLKASALNSLRSDIQTLQEQYKGLLDEKLKQVGDMKDMFMKDPASLRQQLMNTGWMQDIQKKSELFTELQNRSNTGQPVDTAKLNGLRNELQQFEGTKSLITILEENNKKWQQNGLLKKIKESGITQNKNVQQVLNDPQIISRMAKEKLNLSGLQKMLLSITKLNIGESTTDFSKLSSSTIINGLNTGFMLNNKKSIDVLAGVQKTYSSMLDMPFSNSVYNNTNTMMGMKLLAMSENGGSSSFSLLSFQSRAGGDLPFATFATPRKSMVFGLSKQINFGVKNHVEVEVSKSSGSVLNATKESSPGFNQDQNASGDFLKSTAVALSYSGQNENSTFSKEFFIKYSGIDYYNPSASFLPGGTKEGGGSLRKSFLKNKLQVYLRSNIREYKFSETIDSRWRNFNHLIDVKWKMRKGQSVSIRYQPAKSLKLAGGAKTLNSLTERLAASAVMSKKMGSIQYRNSISLAYLNNYYSFSPASVTSNKSIQFSALQNFSIARYSFYNNTVYNKVNTPGSYFFFNTSFSSDIGVTYSIGKNLSASSSVNYQSVKDWYQQIAYRQSLTGQIGKSIRMDIYFDLGKSIKTVKPIPYGFVRADWSIQYLF